jgi:hypothetical protein
MKLKRFNENDNTITLSMEDVKNLKHNLGSWNEDTKLIIDTKYVQGSGTWNGKEVVIYELSVEMDEFGYAVSIDGNIEYLIGIYEPHGCSLNAKRGMVTFWGHEEIIQLWLDDGEFETKHTR